MRAGHGERGVRQLSFGAGFVAVLLWAAGAAGQTLTLKERPATRSLVCNAAAQAPRCGAGDPEEVDRLVNAATQAMILGDLSAADDHLTQALELDACAVEATYLQGRIVAQTENIVAASEWFCRYLSLAPEGASAPEARRRLVEAVDAGARSEVLARFQEGVTRYRQGRLEDSEAAFTAVVERHPVPEAFYNRAVVRLAQERPAAARPDLRRFLELRPENEQHRVIRAALRVPVAHWSPKAPGTAFLLGAVLPGAGQFYTNRTWYGLTVASLVAGSAAAGVLFERTTIQCRAPDPSGECPPDQIAGTKTTRPFLLPALGAGAGIMLLTAIEAAIHASGREPPLTVAAGDGWTVELAAHPTPSGAVDIRVMQFRVFDLLSHVRR